jgi:TolB protein
VGARPLVIVLIGLLAALGALGAAAVPRAGVAASCVSLVGPGIPPPAEVPAGLPGFHAAWYGQSGYMSLCPGDTQTATVAYYNSGSSGWVAGKMGEAAFLGTWEPDPGQDRPSRLGGDGQAGSPASGWPRYNRLADQPAGYVGPGQVAWFQFRVVAPAVPGVYQLYLRPLIEGERWLEDYGVYWQVVVLNTDGRAPPPTATSSATPTPAPLVRRADGAELLFSPAGGESAQNPAFSPDGGSVLFTLSHGGYNKGDAGLYVMPVGGGSARALVDEPGAAAVNLPGSCWNPATGRIAFSSDRQERAEIWTMSAAGGGLFRVTRHSDGTGFLEPTFSADGRWIVFEVDEPGGGKGSIWKVAADGTGLTRLIDGPGTGTDNRQPNWSPAGDRILFQRAVGTGTSWRLFTMGSDGSGLRAVSAGPDDTDAAWSPDGRWIVYSTSHGELTSANVYVVSLNGGAPVRITRQSGYDGAPSWSPDGRWIAFESVPNASGATAIWRIAVPPLP